MIQPENRVRIRNHASASEVACVIQNASVPMIAWAKNSIRSAPNAASAVKNRLPADRSYRLRSPS